MNHKIYDLIASILLGVLYNWYIRK